MKHTNKVFGLVGIIAGIVIGQNVTEYRQEHYTVPVENVSVTYNMDNWTIIEWDKIDKDVPELFPANEFLSDAEKQQQCKQSKECQRLAEAIVFEARSESRQGMQAVASVIMNRVESRRFPNTIDGVVTQPYQFSYLFDMHKQTKPTDDDWQLAYVVAYNIKHNIVERVTESDHYLNPDKLARLPSWAKVYKQTEIIGSHHFYTSER